MNRSNPFRFDLRNGIRFIAKKFLVLPLLVSLVCFEFMLRLRETASLYSESRRAIPVSCFLVSGLWNLPVSYALLSCV